MKGTRAGKGEGDGVGRGTRGVPRGYHAVAGPAAPYGAVPMGNNQGKGTNAGLLFIGISQ